jgi:hypothetical protein
MFIDQLGHVFIFGRNKNIRILFGKTQGLRSPSHHLPQNLPAQKWENHKPDNITDGFDLDDQIIRHGLPLDLIIGKFFLTMGLLATSKQTATWVGLQSASILRKILQKPKTALVGWPLEFFKALTA